MRSLWCGALDSRGTHGHSRPSRKLVRGRQERRDRACGSKTNADIFSRIGRLRGAAGRSQHDVRLLVASEERRGELMKNCVLAHPRIWGSVMLKAREWGDLNENAEEVTEACFLQENRAFGATHEYLAGLGIGRGIRCEWRSRAGRGCEYGEETRQGAGARREPRCSRGRPSVGARRRRNRRG